MSQDIHDQPETPEVAPTTKSSSTEAPGKSAPEAAADAAPDAAPDAVPDAATDAPYPTTPDKPKTRAPKSQALKPATAAKKLGVYLPATPESFQSEPLTREQYDDLAATPPEWLVDLRKNGPHPRPEVARKLGVTISGLVRGGIEDPLTTDEIHSLLEEMPEWLSSERYNLALVRDEELRVKQQNAERAAKRAAEGR